MQEKWEKEMKKQKYFSYKYEKREYSFLKLHLWKNITV